MTTLPQPRSQRLPKPASTPSPALTVALLAFVAVMFASPLLDPVRSGITSAVAGQAAAPLLATSSHVPGRIATAVRVPLVPTIAAGAHDVDVLPITLAAGDDLWTSVRGTYHVRCSYTGPCSTRLAVVVDGTTVVPGVDFTVGARAGARASSTVLLSGVLHGLRAGPHQVAFRRIASHNVLEAGNGQDSRFQVHPIAP